MIYRGLPGMDKFKRAAAQLAVMVGVCALGTLLWVALLSLGCGPRVIAPPPELQKVFLVEKDGKNQLERCLAEAGDEGCGCAPGSYWDYVWARNVSLQNELDRCKDGR